LAGALALVPTSSANGTVNPALTGYSYKPTATGKALQRVSGGTLVAYLDERQSQADAQSGTGASDLPPDVTATALGCANRGSATNTRVNQDCTARRQAEEQIAINPDDPNNLIAGQNDSRIGFNHCGFDYSLDGGKTWGDGIPPYYQHLSLIGHTYDAASDPAVTFAGSPAAAWFSCIVFDVNSNASAVFASPSTPALKGSAYANIGAGASRYVVAEAADTSTFYDKEFISGAPDGSVYVTFTRFNSATRCSADKQDPTAYCSSEIYLSKWDPHGVFEGLDTPGNGGGKWSTPILINGDSKDLCVGGTTFDPDANPSACNFNQGSMPVVRPDGSVYVVWNNGNTPTAVNQTLGRLVNANLSMGPVTKVGVDDESNIATCDFGRGPEECVKSLDIRTNDFPALAVDPKDSKHLVAVWTDSRTSTEKNPGMYNVVVSDSTDGGVTWSDKTGHGTLLFPAAGGALFEPSVTITGAGRTVVSTYRANAYTRHDVGGGTYGYGLFQRRAGVSTFSSYVPVSDSQSYPSPETSPTQTGFLGDYSSIASPHNGDVVYPIWADTRNTSSAGPDEDVFVKRVTF
jgi:hypothetical protein